MPEMMATATVCMVMAAVECSETTGGPMRGRAHHLYPPRCQAKCFAAATSHDRHDYRADSTCGGSGEISTAGFRVPLSAIFGDAKITTGLPVLCGIGAVARNSR